jgi:hypothetical protein
MQLAGSPFLLLCTTWEKWTENQPKQDVKKVKQVFDRKRKLQEIARDSPNRMQALNFMRDVFARMLQVRNNAFEEHKTALFGSLPMKLAVLEHVKNSLKDEGIFVPMVHEDRHVASSMESESYRIVPVFQRLARSYSCRYSATNRVILTLHGIDASQLIFGGEGQAVKLGGSRKLQYTPPLTALCGASTTIDPGQKVRNGKYICWRSSVGRIEQFIQQDGRLKNDLTGLQVFYERHFALLGTMQTMTTKCFLDNITAFAMSIKLPRMNKAPEVAQIEIALGKVHNPMIMVLRRYLLVAFGVWNNGCFMNLADEKTVAFCHILVESGIFLLCHKLTLCYEANARTLGVIDKYLDDHEDSPQVKTSTMYNALGTASHCVEILEHRSIQFLHGIDQNLQVHLSAKCSLIVQSYLPTFR